MATGGIGAKKHLGTFTDIGFDSLFTYDFTGFALTASQVNTTVQSAEPLPAAMKIIAVGVNMTGTVASTCSVNVVLGTAAEGIVPATANAIAVNGTPVFSSDQAVTMTANQNQILVPTNIDVIYPNNVGPLTIRTVTASGTTGTITVVLFCKHIDQVPQKPLYNQATGVPNQY